MLQDKAVRRHRLLHCPAGRVIFYPSIVRIYVITSASSNLL